MVRKVVMQDGDLIVIEQCSNGWLVALNIIDTNGEQISKHITICATFPQVIQAIEKYSDQKVHRLEGVCSVLPKV